MAKETSIDSFFNILKDIKTDGKTLKYEINPFLSSFIEKKLIDNGIPITNSEINKQVLNFLFDSFHKLQENDKLLILFSYVILRYLLDNIDTEDKEGIIKVIKNIDTTSKDYKEYKVLLDLDVNNIDKSIIIKLINFQLEEEYKQMNATNRAIKIWAIKAFILTFIGATSLFTVLYFIPYTHKFLFGDNFIEIFKRFGEIIELVFFNK